MDNVVQLVNISDIIPGNFKPSNEEKEKINNLATLIKQYGLLDPILLRPKDGKYEIVLGIEKYQAAINANQKMIPAIIKEVDDDTFLKYLKVDNKNRVSSKSLPKENPSKKEKNSDIINLSELSKIKLEYERDDKNMNNFQMNNNIPNNSLGQQNMNPAPTFGGRFFPTLEDESPNAMGGLTNQSNIPAAPPIDNTNKNLIDLTDLSIEKESPQISSTSISDLQSSMPSIEQNSNKQETNSFEIPDLNSKANGVNMENMIGSNMPPKIVPEPVPMDILKTDFGAPVNPQSPMNINSSLDINTPPNQMGSGAITMPQQPQFGPMGPPNTMMTPPQIPNFSGDPRLKTPLQTPMAQVNTFQAPPIRKDITPVKNTIKNLVNSLREFGYNINLTEEDLPNIGKIIIEIEK